MKIYSQEIKDGLKDVLSSQSHGSILFNSPAKTVTKDQLEGSSLFSSIATNLNQLDLYYLGTILVSTVWNENDDIFLPEEVWSAKATPEDKPFNLGHNPNKIIGHITENYAIDPDYNTLDDSLSVDELPPLFHLFTSAVIYRHIKSRDPELTKEITTLISEIEDDEWFVSMECLFPSFDYAMQKEDGTYDILERNKDTAYLTKHLRIYGGVGEYNGRKLGRVLRNITFSGKGLVRKPANPESVIFTTANDFGVNNSRQDIIDGEITMAEDNKVDFEKKSAELQGQVAALELQLKEIDVASFKSQLEAKASDLKAKDEQISDLTNKLAEAEKSVVSLKSDNEKINTTLAEKTDSLQKIQADIARANRITTLVDKGVDKAAAETLVDKFIALADEQFGEIVNMQTELVEAKCADKDKETKSSKAEEKEDTSTAAKELLETAKAEKEPDLNLAEAESANHTKALQEAVVAYLKN